MKITHMLLLMICVNCSFAQPPALDSNFILWSKNYALKESDFKIKTSNTGSKSFGQYSLDYNLSGASFALSLPKDYKKKVRNYFIKSASWIDTTYNTALSINYQQLLFDMSEIYTRKFRKEIFLNRKKIFWGKLKLDNMSSNVMTDFANRRAQYEMDTNSGSILEKHENWKLIIAKELDELKEFSSD